MGTAPTYAATPRPVDFAAISTANTNRDGTGTIATLATGSANGYKLMEVDVQAQVTTTAGMIRLFLSNDGGTTWRLFDELPVGAVTVGASTPAYRTSKNYMNVILDTTNDVLGVSTHNAEAFKVYAFGADL
jgi:hypothetical protein